MTHSETNSHFGKDAELIALRAGVYHSLLARIADKQPQSNANVLSFSSITTGTFITLTKYFNGTLEWFAITGPDAESIGLQFGMESWNRHCGPTDHRKIEFAQLCQTVPN